MSSCKFKQVKKVIFVLVQLSTISFYSQNKEWMSYELDSIVSIDMPDKVYERDTINDYLKIHELFSFNNSVSYSVRKLHLKDALYNQYGIDLPKDRKSLKKYYQTIALASSELRHEENSLSRSINYDDLEGYRFINNTSYSNPYNEVQLFLINKDTYVFQYSNQNGLDSIQRNAFFNSITFNDEIDLKQLYPDKSSIFFKRFIIILIVVLLLSTFLKLKNRRKVV